MLKVLIKHFIYEQCINVLFEGIYNNFVKPRIIQGYFDRYRFKYGHDMNELIDSMASDIQKEIDREILMDLVTKASVKS